MDEKKVVQSLNNKNVINQANETKTNDIVIEEPSSSSNPAFISELFLSSPDFNDAALIPKSHMNKNFN
jgi:hypothetical protein